MPTQEQLASRLRTVTHLRESIPTCGDVTRYTGYSRRQYASEFGTYREAIRTIQPHSNADEVTLGLRPYKWRHRCPRGHRYWRPIDGEFYCGQCKSDPDIEEHRYDHLVDRIQMEAIPFEEFLLE